MKLNDMALGVVITALGAAIIYHARGFPDMAGMEYGPAFFPTLIGAGFAICGVSLLGNGALAVLRGTADPWVVRADWMGTRLNTMRALGVIVAVIAYVFLVESAGFLLTVFVVTLALLVLLGNGAFRSLSIAIILPLILYYAFQIGLRVPLPRGPIEMMFF